MLQVLTGTTDFFQEDLPRQNVFKYLCIRRTVNHHDSTELQISMFHEPFTIISDRLNVLASSTFLELSDERFRSIT